MAVKPTKPVSPPQALRSVPENFSANSEGWIAYQAGVFPDWIDAISDYVDERADEALAAVLSGTLPSMVGKAGQVIRANSTGTAVEFATSAQAQQSLGFHAFDNAFLGAGTTGNLAIGAADFGNVARWLNTQTANGVTLTRVGFGIGANGCTYVDYSVVGTPTTGSHTMDVYVQQSSVTSAASGQVFTASCYAQIIGGTTPADTNTGIRVEMRGQTALAVQTEAFFTPVTRPTAQTLSTLTSTLAAATTAQIICGVVLRVQAGVTANFTVRISGLQFDRGAARLNYPFKALSAADARAAMGVQGAGNLIINGTGRINQREYVSGAATTAADQFTLDRWHIKVSGQALTFTGTAAGYVMTAPAGGVAQTIEGANITGSTYCLSWVGTATATVNGTAVANGGTITLAAGANATVRFTGGTFTQAQLELGTVPTHYERIDVGAEYRMCYRYFARINAEFKLDASLGGANISTGATWFYPTPLRATPTLSVFFESSTNADPIASLANKGNGVFATWAWTSGTTIIGRTKAAVIQASAEITA